MFGGNTGNTVQSSWANPQQNQQQPPQQSGSAFGQPSGFGSGGGKQVICLYSVCGTLLIPEQLLDPQVLLVSPSSHRQIQCLEIWRTQAQALQPLVRPTAFLTVLLATKSYLTQAHLTRIPHNKLRARQHLGLPSLQRALVHLEGEVPRPLEVAVVLLAQQLEREPPLGEFLAPIPTRELQMGLAHSGRIELPLALA